MKKTFFTFLAIIFLVNNIHSQQPHGTIYFASGKATLDGESKTKLKILFENIKLAKSPSVEISGFTDLNGSPEFNLELSKKRALAVSDYFTTIGVEKNKISIQFFGEDKPIAKNEKNLRENRRVEIRIGTVKKKDDKTIRGIFGKLWKGPVKHIFSETKNATTEDLMMSSPGGTKIWIPGNSLCRPNGEIAKGDIEIELTEYYKKSDMLLANLHTASDSTMLETGGMIYIVARSRGERLALKKGSEMKIEFPVSKKEQDMDIFVGAQHGNQMNWIRQSDNGVNVSESSGSIVPRYVGGSAYKGYDSISAKKMSKIDNLILSSDRLGWINCDRFSKIEAKSNLSVEIDTVYKAIVRLVFKNLNAIMPGYSDGKGTSSVINIPVGQKATIVAFGMIKETPYFISKDIVISDNQVERLVPKRTSFEALRTLLKKVD